jgi:hypothetical protein
LEINGVASGIDSAISVGLLARHTAISSFHSERFSSLSGPNLPIDRFKIGTYDVRLSSRMRFVVQEVTRIPQHYILILNQFRRTSECVQMRHGQGRIRRETLAVIDLRRLIA